MGQKERFEDAVAHLIGLLVLPELLVSRYFDGDVDGNTENKTFHSHEGSWLVSSRVLQLTAAQLANAVIKPVATLFSDFDPNGSGQKTGRGCEMGIAASGQSGDYVGGISMRFPFVKPGQTKTVTLGYRRF